MSSRRTDLGVVVVLPTPAVPGPRGWWPCEPLEPRLFLSSTKPTVTLEPAEGLPGFVVVARTTAPDAPLTVKLQVRGRSGDTGKRATFKWTASIPSSAASAVVEVPPPDGAADAADGPVVVRAVRGHGYRVKRRTAAVELPPLPAAPATPATPAVIAGPVAAALPSVADDAALETHRFLYAFDAPKSRQGFETLVPQIEVFDVDDGHRWVKNIPIPANIFDVRGVAANPSTGRLYVSYLLSPRTGYQPGGLLCMDLNSNQLIWRRDYDQRDVPAPDRFSLTPDGKKIYMPGGEFGTGDFWVVINAATGDPIGRVHHTTSAQHAIVSGDGSRAFLGGQEKQSEPPEVRHTVGVVDTATDRVVGRVGPFRDVVRPFTINGDASLVFATTDNFVGFQIGDVASGAVVRTVPAPGIAQPTTPSRVAPAHGIALTPDERELYLVDTVRRGLHVWDVSRVGDGAAPVYGGFIRLRQPNEDIAGNPDPAATNDTPLAPAWVTVSYDGRYVYPEGGEIIDRATHQVVGQLRPKAIDVAGGGFVNAPYTHSRYMLEVVVAGGRVVQATDQYGVGRVR